MHTPILAAIQFRFLSPNPSAAADEADPSNDRVDIGLPIELVLTPPDALLQDAITVTVISTAGTATRRKSF